MEEVCELENCRQHYNESRPIRGVRGVDGMTVDELPEYLKQHELEIGNSCEAELTNRNR